MQSNWGLVFGRAGLKGQQATMLNDPLQGNLPAELGFEPEAHEINEKHWLKGSLTSLAMLIAGALVGQLVV